MSVDEKMVAAHTEITEGFNKAMGEGQHNEAIAIVLMGMYHIMSTVARAWLLDREALSAYAESIGAGNRVDGNQR